MPWAEGPSSGGSSATQRSVASGQRGAKRQPGGIACGGGTVPSIVCSRSRSSSRRGIEREQAEGVGVLRRRANSVRTPARSTTLPGVHDDDLVGRLGDDAEVVGDEHHRRPELGPAGRA